jgi:hypothetical protein
MELNSELMLNGNLLQRQKPELCLRILKAC